MTAAAHHPALALLRDATARVWRPTAMTVDTVTYAVTLPRDWLDRARLVAHGKVGGRPEREEA